jgi:hypothetical protein
VLHVRDAGHSRRRRDRRKAMDLIVSRHIDLVRGPGWFPSRGEHLKRGFGSWDHCLACPLILRCRYCPAAAPAQSSGIPVFLEAGKGLSDYKVVILEGP